MILRQYLIRRGTSEATHSTSKIWRKGFASAIEQHTQDYERIDHNASILGHAERTLSEPSFESNPVPSPRDPKWGTFAEDYHERLAHKKAADRLGSDLTPFYKPHELVLNPPRPSDITLELLMASQSHLGHHTGLWHPGNARYIYGIRDGIHIISPDVTASHLRRACKIVEGTAFKGGLILFVGTRKGQERAVIKAAELAMGCHLFDRWVPGSITNRIQLLASCRRKVVDPLDNEVHGYDEQVLQEGPLKPDLVVVLNPLENFVLLRECKQNNIPTVGVVDTDCNPTWFTYPIPANDDSRRCTNLIAGVLGRAAETGHMFRLGVASELGVVMTDRNHKLDIEHLDNSEKDEKSAAAESISPDSTDENWPEHSFDDPNDGVDHIRDEVVDENEDDIVDQNSKAIQMSTMGDENLISEKTRTIPEPEVESAVIHAMTAVHMGIITDHDVPASIIGDSMNVSAEENASEETRSKIANILSHSGTSAINKLSTDGQSTDVNNDDQTTKDMNNDESGAALQRLANYKTPSSSTEEKEAQYNISESGLERLIVLRRRALGEIMTSSETELLSRIEKDEAEFRAYMEEEKDEMRAELDRRAKIISDITKEVQAETANEEDEEIESDLNERRGLRRRDEREDRHASRVGPVMKSRGHRGSRR